MLIVMGLIVLVLAGVGVMALVQKDVVTDPSGRRSVYSKGGRLDPAVYVSKFAGDGLGGTTTITVVDGADKESFETVFVDVETDTWK